MNIVTQQITEEMIARRNEVAMLVASLTGVPADDIMSRCRRQDIADARKLVMWTLAVLCGYTRNNVGILMERNQSAVTYAVRWVNEGYGGKEVERLRQEIENTYKTLKKQLKMTRLEFINWFEERFALTKNDIYELGQLYDEVTKPHWISVEERKPKFSHETDVYQYSEEVIVTDGEYCTSASWVHSTLAGWIAWLNRGGEELKGVTHWMPMPEAPTVAKNATVKKGGKP